MTLTMVTSSTLPPTACSSLGGGGEVLGVGLTIHEEIVIWYILIWSHRSSPVIAQVEHAGFDAKPVGSITVSVGVLCVETEDAETDQRKYLTRATEMCLSQSDLAGIGTVFSVH